MPNIFAYLMLAAWPLVTVGIFRKLPVGLAVIWSLLLAYLFLPPPPAVFDFPLMPPLNKETLPAVTAFILCLAMYGSDMQVLPRSRLARILMFVFVISPLATVLTNGEPVFYGRVGLPALRFVEAIALMVNQALLLLPFILARNFLTKESDHRALTMALFVSGMIYSVLMLIEVRLSPQLNNWIYGYFQHYFAQSIRFGGFRPIVFLYHGLWVAFFALMALTAAVSLMRAEEGRKSAWYFVSAGYLGVVLVLCKSVASLAYGVVLLPLVAFFGRATQFRIAALLGLLALAYPLAKGIDVVPEQFLLEQARLIEEDRANSLKFRFDNERLLIDRALEKPVFGWGSWGRNHLLDPNSGRILTVTDGRWVIVIGVFGWVGFLAEFGLLALPLFILALGTWNMAPEKISPFIGPLALLLGFNMIDLLPNATITFLTWMISGALLGYVEKGLPKRERRRTRLRSIM